MSGTDDTSTDGFDLADRSSGTEQAASGLAVVPPPLEPAQQDRPLSAPTLLVPRSPFDRPTGTGSLAGKMTGGLPGSTQTPRQTDDKDLGRTSADKGTKGVPGMVKRLMGFSRIGGRSRDITRPLEGLVQRRVGVAPTPGAPPALAGPSPAAGEAASADDAPGRISRRLQRLDRFTGPLTMPAGMEDDARAADDDGDVQGGRMAGRATVPAPAGLATDIPPIPVTPQPSDDDDLDFLQLLDRAQAAAGESMVPPLAGLQPPTAFPVEPRTPRGPMEDQQAARLVTPEPFTTSSGPVDPSVGTEHLVQGSSRATFDGSVPSPRTLTGPIPGGDTLLTPESDDAIDVAALFGLSTEEIRGLGLSDHPVPPPVAPPLLPATHPLRDRGEVEPNDARAPATLATPALSAGTADMPAVSTPVPPPPLSGGVSRRDTSTLSSLPAPSPTVEDDMALLAMLETDEEAPLSRSAPQDPMSARTDLESRHDVDGGRRQGLDQGQAGDAVASSVQEFAPRVPGGRDVGPALVARPQEAASRGEEQDLDDLADLDAPIDVAALFGLSQDECAALDWMTGHRPPSPRRVPAVARPPPGPISCPPLPLPWVPRSLPPQDPR